MTIFHDITIKIPMPINLEQLRISRLQVLENRYQIAAVLDETRDFLHSV